MGIHGYNIFIENQDPVRTTKTDKNTPDSRTVVLSFMSTSDKITTLENKRLCSFAEEDRFCETCGTTLGSVGEEFIHTEIEFIPAKVRAIDYYRETFECRTCRKNGEPYMGPSPMPYPVIQHSWRLPLSLHGSCIRSSSTSFPVLPWAKSIDGVSRTIDD